MIPLRHVRQHNGYVMTWLLCSSAPKLKEAVEVGGQDVWVETDHEWIRVHNEPRTSTYVPEKSQDGPNVEALSCYRRTECYHTVGGAMSSQTIGSGWSNDFTRILGSTKSQVHEDDWHSSLHAQLGEASWTGWTRPMPMPATGQS